MEKEYKNNVFEKEVSASLKRVYEMYRNDPLAMGLLMYKLLEERENSNRLMKTLLARIEKLEKRIEELSSSKSKETVQKEEVKEEILLSEADEKIVEIISKKGKATAKEIAKEMNYKGANAASARMNRLYENGILKKKRIGKKVYFFLRRQGDQF